MDIIWLKLKKRVLEVEKEYLDVEVMFKHKFHFGKKKHYSLENAPQTSFSTPNPLFQSWSWDTAEL